MVPAEVPNIQTEEHNVILKRQSLASLSCLLTMSHYKSNCTSFVRIFQIDGHKFISYYNCSMPPSLNKVYYYYYDDDDDDDDDDSYTESLFHFLSLFFFLIAFQATTLWCGHTKVYITAT